MGAAILAIFLTTTFSPATVAADCTDQGLADAIAAGGTTTFDCSGEIEISEAIQVTNAVVLEATADLRLVGLGNTRLFEISATGSLTLSNFTLVGGETTNGGGGAIFNRGTVVLLSCTVTNNTANGPEGRDGRDGRDEGENNGDDGQNGVSGKRTAGGAVYNIGLFRAIECGFFGNRAVGGNGGAGGSGDTGLIVGGDGGAGGGGGGASGGAIFNAGRLEIFSCGFYLNEARAGDAGEGGEGGESLSDAFAGFTGDGARGGVGAGGAIYSTNKASTLIVGSTFSENFVQSGNSTRAATSNSSGKNAPSGPSVFGGGFANYGSAVVLNSTFNANEIQAGNGGFGGDSDFKGGDGGDGGAAWGGNLFNGGKGVAVTNCTFSDGIARPGTNGIAGVGSFPGDDGHRGQTRGANVGNGKGKFVLSHTILANPPSTNTFHTNTTVTWVTNIISDVRGGTNAAEEVCTRIKTTRDNGTVVRDDFDCVETRIVGSNIVAGTTVTITTNTDKITITDSRANAAGAFKDGGYNLSSDRTINFKKKSTSRANEDALLGPLGDFGGPTETMEPLDGSPAIDGGDPDFSLETDQRGIERPQGYAGDIGAVEVELGPPQSLTEPEDVSVYSGENVSFVFLVSGRQIQYQWYINGTTLLAGATNSTLLLTNVQTTNAGTYHAVATNPFGELASQDAILEVAAAAPILTQTPPASTNVAVGATLTLVAQATGSRPLRFQWHFTNESSVTDPIPNATNATLTVTNFGLANEGNYTLEVSNPVGTIFSDSTMVQRIGVLP